MNDKTRTEIMRTAIKLFEEGHKVKKILESVSKVYPKSQFPNAVEFAKCGIQMYRSLNFAIDQAGGAGWSVDRVCEITVMDLFSRLATNNVRFFYAGKGRRTHGNRSKKSLS